MMKDTSKEHKHEHITARFGIISVSSSRTLAEDDAGDLMVELIEEQGHKVTNRTLVKDGIEEVRTAVKAYLDDTNVDAIITTGGTGLAKLDVTIETVKPLLEKELTGFASMFTQLGYEEIGSPSILSRATAGTAQGTIIFCVPGSPRACKLALETLILPEIGHIIKHMR